MQFAKFLLLYTLVTACTGLNVQGDDMAESFRCIDITLHYTAINFITQYGTTLRYNNL